MASNETSPPHPPVVPYQRRDVPEWLTIGWYGSEDEAAHDTACLTTLSLPWELRPSVGYMIRPDGTRATLRLMVHDEDVADARRAIEPADDKLSSLEPMAALAGDGPIDYVDEKGKTIRFVAIGRYDTAAEMMEKFHVLLNARVGAIRPLLWPRGSKFAASAEGRPGRFVLRVREDDVDAAREAFIADVQPQADTEPRCPKCRSWHVDDSRPTGWLLIGVLRGRPPSEARCTCLRCGHSDARERFFDNPAPSDSVPFASPKDKPGV